MKSMRQPSFYDLFFQGRGGGGRWSHWSPRSATADTSLLLLSRSTFKFMKLFTENTTVFTCCLTLNLVEIIL